jgi:hypothetical protein
MDSSLGLADRSESYLLPAGVLLLVSESQYINDFIFYCVHHFFDAI